MVKKKNVKSTFELHEIVAKGMIDKKAEEVMVINLTKNKNAIADYFVICSGTSGTHLDAISDAVEQEVWQKLNTHPKSEEGKTNKEWILIDYIDVVAHIFQKDKRKFYGLEELWGDAEITKY
ncbi:MAG: ribosome silencing factor [Cytophagales bacterium]|nr:ribosome silencing factor [Cytophagales bacterium]